MIRQAIVTKVLHATNNKPTRIKAICDAGSVISPWNHEWNAERNHKEAAAKLIGKLKWSNAWAHGVLPNGNNVFVESES